MEIESLIKCLISSSVQGRTQDFRGKGGGGGWIKSPKKGFEHQKSFNTEFLTK